MDNMLTKAGKVDIEVKVVKGRDFVQPHTIIRFKPCYFVEMELDEKKKRTSVGSKGDRLDLEDYLININANLSSLLLIRLYCKHSHTRDDHVIGETTLDLLKVGRNKDIVLDVHGSDKRMTVTFSDAEISSLESQSQLLHHMNVIESVSAEQFRTLSAGWKRFLLSFDSVISVAKTVADLDSRAQVAVAAVAVAVKIVIAQIERDEKVERLVAYIGDLYSYFLDADPIQKITSFKKTLVSLLVQTAECAYFIAEYRKVKLFVQRALITIVTDADMMIAKFDAAFGELKIELILGSSLQAAVVSFRILQKVENIENFMYINRLPHLKGVGWDSSRTCLRGTRQDVIADLVRWASDTSETQESRVCMLLGPPGCGKTSIAHTIAQAFHQQKWLGAAVFLNERAGGNINSQMISSTIALQLADYDESIRGRLAEKIRAVHSLPGADVGQQFPDLIVSALKDLSVIGPILIVVDGINDHLSPMEQHRFLRAITMPSTLSELPVNFRILLTSHNGNLATNSPLCYIREVGFDVFGGALDLCMYIHESLDLLFARKPQLLEQYTGQQLHDILMPRAMGMHLWVSTAFQALSLCTDEGTWAILDNLLASIIPLSKEDAMDILYRTVLPVIPYPALAHAVFYSSTNLLEPLQLPNSPGVDAAQPKPTKYCLQLLQDLGLLVETPHSELGMFTLNLSFKDFVTDPQRSSRTGYFIDVHRPLPQSLAELCLDEMIHTLKYNVCELDDLMVLNEEILDREDRILRFIPDSLQYACCTWISHIKGAAGDPGMINAILFKIQEFIFTHLLHWIEVMSLLNRFDLVRSSLELLSTWLKSHVSVDDSCYIVVLDCLRFIQMFSPIISKAAMQTYISALPLMPSNTLLFGFYCSKIPDLTSDLCFGWVTIPSTGTKNWNPETDAKLKKPATVLIRQTKPLSSAACLGYIIAISGYYRDSIFLCDVRTGREVGTELIHPRHSKSLSFSPSGQHIVSTSEGPLGGIIGIWDIGTGACIHRITAASKHVSLVAYSGDGNSISAWEEHPISWEQRFRVWNASTAELIREFEFRGLSVHNIVLSPDGRRLAVHEAKKFGIHFFDIESGEPVGKAIARHDNPNNPLRFLKIIWPPDGHFLATSSTDHIIHVWSMEQGSYLKLERIKFFESSRVIWPECLGFTPDGSYIAAIHLLIDGTDEKHRICGSVWDTSMGRLIWSEILPFGLTHSDILPFGLTGFMHGMQSLSFLPDSQEILFVENTLKHPPVRLVNLAPPYLTDPPSFHKDKHVPIIQYSCLISSGNKNYASHVDNDGWVLNTAGERKMWVPYPNFELSTSDAPGGPTLESSFRSKILDLKNPETKEVALSFKIKFDD